MWKCPKCGRTFVVRNVEHTCKLLPVDSHFTHKSTEIRALYDRLERMARSASRDKMEVVAMKSMINFRGRVNFAGIRVMRNRLDVGLLLPRVLRHPRVQKVFTQSQRSHFHTFDIRSKKDLDREFAGWLAEAWRAGMQLHLAEPAAPIAALEALETEAPPRNPRLKSRPLWRCPKCGKRYVTKNISHSCRRISEAERLQGKSEHVVWLYRRIVKMLRQHGPLLINPGKTGIAFQGRMRFGGVQLGKDSVRLRFILTRKLDSPRVKQISAYGPRCFGHHVTIRSAEDLDTELQTWLAESYRVGMQSHLLRNEKAP